MGSGVGIMRFQPGHPCCEIVCPDCTAPTPESTGSTAAETAWYLTTSDPNGDRASFHVIDIDSQPSRIIDITTYVPGNAWVKLRSYFAWKDSDNHAYAELWGVMSKTAGTYWYTYHSRVVEMTGGTETEIAAHTFPAVHYSSAPVHDGIAITYDEATNVARVVCYVISGASVYVQFRSYDHLSLTQDPTKGVYYGWGWGAIVGSPSTTFPDAYANARHVDNCQSFPHIFLSGGLYTIPPYHPWWKSTMPETATLEVSGVTCTGTNPCSTCAVLNDTFAIGRIAIDQLMDFTSFTVSTMPENLVTDDMDAGCVIGVTTYRIQYRMIVNGTTIILAAIAVPYTATKGWAPILLATATASFSHGDCWGYDGANAIDGLVFDQWTNAGTSGAQVQIKQAVPPYTVYLTFPDFSAATATITLP